MKQNHRSYSNIRTWKETEDEESYSVVPAPNAPWFQLLATVPTAGVFYWVLHYKIDIHDESLLWPMDLILIGTSILMVVIFFWIRHRTMRDLRPHLVYSKSSNEVSFPRCDKVFRLDDSNRFFVSYDLFDKGNEDTKSELNLIELTEDGERCIPLLKLLGRSSSFARIGKRLTNLGVPFEFREESSGT